MALELTEDQRNSASMVRFVGLCMAVPGLSIGGFFLLDLNAHLGHFFLIMPVGLAGVFAMVRAPHLVKKWTEKDTGDEKYVARFQE